MEKEKLEAKITKVLLSKVKFIGSDDHSYYGCPADLIKSLIEELEEYKIDKTN